MRTKIQWLRIGEGAGAFRLDIPVYTIGSGNSPVLGITCSVHGDEHAGLFITARLADILESAEDIQGTIHIILAANPAAQFVNSRVSLLDLKDLNRAGAGRREGSFTERAGAVLFEFLSTCNFAINIHEFEMLTPSTAVFMNAGSAQVKITTLAAIKAFAPDIIWAINASQSGDMQYLATLDTALANVGIPNFPIETTQLAFLDHNEIDKVANGLARVAAHLGVIYPAQGLTSALAPAFTRQEVTADYAGLWEPQGVLKREVRTGDEIGHIRKFPDFKLEKISSPSSGLLVQYRNRQIVSTGTSLFSIGHNANEIIAPYLE